MLHPKLCGTYNNYKNLPICDITADIYDCQPHNSHNHTPSLCSHHLLPTTLSFSGGFLV